LNDEVTAEGQVDRTIREGVLVKVMERNEVVHGGNCPGGETGENEKAQQFNKILIDRWTRWLDKGVRDMAEYFEILKGCDELDKFYRARRRSGKGDSRIPPYGDKPLSRSPRPSRVTRRTKFPRFRLVSASQIRLADWRGS
jgi:hypothetical protein